MKLNKLCLFTLLINKSNKNLEHHKSLCSNHLMKNKIILTKNLILKIFLLLLKKIDFKL